MGTEMVGSTAGIYRYSVTFVDNHDTYRDNKRLNNNILASNAHILAQPGYTIATNCAEKIKNLTPKTRVL
jgi:hypothetical protein